MSMELQFCIAREMSYGRQVQHDWTDLRPEECAVLEVMECVGVEIPYPPPQWSDDLVREHAQRQTTGDADTSPIPIRLAIFGVRDMSEILRVSG